MDGIAYFHDVMNQLAMQALAVGCQSPLRMGVLPPCSFVPCTLFPTLTRFTVLLDTPLLIVVLWISSAALPSILALQATLFPGVGCQFLAKRDEIGFALPWHDRQRLGPISRPMVSLPTSSCFGLIQAWPIKTSCTE